MEKDTTNNSMKRKRSFSLCGVESRSVSAEYSICKAPFPGIVDIDIIWHHLGVVCLRKALGTQKEHDH